MVLRTQVVCAFVPWSYAPIENAALAASVGPTKAVRDRHFVALVLLALGAAAMGPAEPPRLGLSRALVHLAEH